MSEHQSDLPLEAAEPSGSGSAAPPDLREEIARTWGLPLGERVEIALRNGQVDALSGVLELVAAPDFPWAPRQPLTLRIAGFSFSSREIERWTRM